jgi:hypothetical protein
MERLVVMDRDQFVEQMQEDVRRLLREVADAVNNAPDGNVINGSEIAVRDAMVELQRRAFEKAVQMRIDSTESSFSPSQGCGGQVQGEQGASAPVGGKRQRADRVSAHPVVRHGPRKR